MQIRLDQDYKKTGLLENSLIESAQPEFFRRPPVFVDDAMNMQFDPSITFPQFVPRKEIALTAIENAKVFGQRCIVDEKGYIHLDEEVDNPATAQRILSRFADRSTSLFHEDTDIVQKDGEFYSERLDSESEYLDGVLYSLLSIEPSNYGSWMFRILPKLAYLSRCSDVTKILCWSPFRWQKDLLNFFGIPDDKIVNIDFNKTYRVKRVYVLTCPNPVCYLNETTIAFYRSILESNKVSVEPKRCLYVSRIGTARSRNFRDCRYFMSEEPFSKELESLGVEIVEPEKLTIQDQIRLFASSAMVVGPSGAGMFNSVFCQAGAAIVDIEAFPHWLYAHVNYFASCGHTYALAFGKPDPEDSASFVHKRWDLDYATLLPKIAALKLLRS